MNLQENSAKFVSKISEWCAKNIDKCIGVISIKLGIDGQMFAYCQMSDGVSPRFVPIEILEQIFDESYNAKKQISTQDLKDVRNMYTKIVSNVRDLWEVVLDEDGRICYRDFDDDLVKHLSVEDIYAKFATTIDKERSKRYETYLTLKQEFEQ
mgnify:CR=1 FL=1